MKKIATILLFTCLFTFQLNAQYSLAVFSGYGQSSFDEDLFGDETKLEQAGYIPLGIQAGYSLSDMEFGSIFLGVEVNYAVIPFTFEFNEDIGRGEENVVDFIVNQIVIGPLAKIKLGKGEFTPFIRLSGGAYLGGAKVEYSDALKSIYREQLGETLEDEDQDIKTAFGFNAGAGADIRIGNTSKFFFEFNYHIVSREPDEEDSESFNANNWAAHVGIQFGIN
jgi:hypothetical protein